MLCDICNVVIHDEPGCYLTTKDLATDKHGWLLYLKSGIAAKILSLNDLADGNFLLGLTYQFASSDSPWALCTDCTSSLAATGFAFRGDLCNPLPLTGHALCQLPPNSPIPDSYTVVSLDDDAMMKAMAAAKAAATTLIAGSSS